MVRAALPTLDEFRAQKLAELAALRWEKEMGGTVFNGMPVATDAVSQTKYIGAVVDARGVPPAVLARPQKNSRPNDAAVPVRRILEPA